MLGIRTSFERGENASGLLLVFRRPRSDTEGERQLRPETAEGRVAYDTVYVQGERLSSVAQDREILRRESPTSVFWQRPQGHFALQVSEDESVDIWHQFERHMIRSEHFTTYVRTRSGTR